METEGDRYLHGKSGDPQSSMMPRSEILSAVSLDVSTTPIMRTTATHTRFRNLRAMEHAMFFPSVDNFG